MTGEQESQNNGDIGAQMYDYERMIGEKFRQLRLERGLSQLEVSERLAAIGFPLHQTNYAKLERGKRPLRVAEAFAVAQIFGLSPATVFYMPQNDLPDGDTKSQAMALLTIEEDLAKAREKMAATVDVMVELTSQRQDFIKYAKQQADGEGNHNV